MAEEETVSWHQKDHVDTWSFWCQDTVE